MEKLMKTRRRLFVCGLRAMATEPRVLLNHIW